MPGIVVRLLIAAGVGVAVWLLKTGASMAAVRVHAGAKPSPVDAEEILWRSAFAAVGLTLITPIEILALDDAFTTGMSSTLFWLTVVAVVPLGGLFLNWVYALDEYLSAVGIFLLYSVFPLLAMIVCRVAGWPVKKWLLSVY
jgi:hypothetical protein